MVPDTERCVCVGPQVELRKDGGGGTGARTATSTQSSALSASSLTMGMTAFDTWRRLSLSMEMAW
jgi:hypothetical protein